MTTTTTDPQATARNLRIQINTCGSWANLITVHENGLPIVLTACAALAIAHHGAKPPTFRAIDPSGRARPLDFSVARLWVRELQAIAEQARQDLDTVVTAPADDTDDTR
mgnify:CR=1 FL=1|jgi:hypothetical protein